MNDKTFKTRKLVLNDLKIKSFPISHSTILVSFSSIKTYSTLRVSKTSMSGRSSNKRYIHASNPNPQSGKPKYPAHNKYVMGFQNARRNTVSRSKQSSCSSNRENKIPFPFTSSFLGNGDYYKPGKRLAFGK